MEVLTSDGAIEVVVSGVVRFGKAASPGGVGNILFDPSKAQELAEMPGRLSLIQVALDPGASPEAVTRELEAVDDHVSVMRGDDYVADVLAFPTSELDATRSAHLGDAAFAVGASRGQLASTLRWELLVAAFGMATAAVVVAMGAAYLLVEVDPELHTFAVPLGQVAASGAAAVALIVGAAALPARWVARRSVIAGLTETSTAG